MKDGSAMAACYTYSQAYGVLNRMQLDDTIKSINQKYGFDKKVHAEYYNNYEIIKLKNNKNYFVPNKSIGKNETDEVLAEISVNNFIPELLSFKTQNGTNFTIWYNWNGRMSFDVSGNANGHTFTDVTLLPTNGTLNMCNYAQNAPYTFTLKNSKGVVVMTNVSNALSKH
jgi:hypothetical protein